MSDTVKKTFIFLVQCRDTYWIESLHLVMLIYTPKCIHFSQTDTNEMRIQLSILDWVMSFNHEYTFFYVKQL